MPPLTTGDRLGPYEILERIGAGGMGEVFKARDPRVDRLVAIKVSKSDFSERFEREARAIAQLNHPRVCQLYDVGPNYLVMEYVEGKPLKGPLPAEKAIEYAGQILDALDAAHAKNVTHRDLKPANILVNKQGVKLLDFGLARIASPADDPMLTSLTEAGMAMGTPAYMPPEQWEGKVADARSDIYGFGCVLYELLTGKRVGPDRIHLGSLEAVLAGCLERDPDERWQAARDVKRALLANMAGPAPAPARRGYLWLAAAMAVVAAAALWIAWSRPSAEQRVVQFQILPPAGTVFQLGLGGGSAISPDGRTIAFVATSSGGTPRLWVRPVASLTARELPATAGARFPFWSPDSESVGFFAQGRLQRIDIAGGPAVGIADAPDGRGGAWNADNVILFAPSISAGFWRVSAKGGTPIPAIAPDPDDTGTAFRFPHFLPDGNKFVFYSMGKAGTSLMMGSLDRPSEKVRLTASPSPADYSAPFAGYPGYLLWSRENTLTAQQLDAERGMLVGEPFAVLGNGVVPPTVGYGSFSLSREGSLLFNGGTDTYELTWFDRTGRALSTVGSPDRYQGLRLSPDGSRVALSKVDASGNRDLWVHEFARGIPIRLTVQGQGYVAVWSPHSDKLAYHVANIPLLFGRSASGTGFQETMVESSFALFINDWSPDNRFIAYTEASTETQSDIWLVPTAGERKPQPYLKTPSNESHAQISPDGKWVAYTSDESGTSEVFVQSLPVGSAKWPVSKGGGSYPRWRKDGRELFYRSTDGKLMAVSVRPDAAGLAFDTPQTLFQLVEPLGTYSYPFDVSADGLRILAMARPVSGSESAPLTVIINWPAGLK